MSKKVVVSLLSISLMAVLIIGAVNPSYVMAIAGLSAIDAKTIEDTQNDSVENLRTGLGDLAEKLAENSTTTYSSKDGAVVIAVLKDGQNMTVNITADTKIMPSDMTANDIGKIIKYAKDYLKPIFDDSQTLGLSGLLLGDAYVQQRLGYDKISISKQYDGLAITAAGQVSTGLLKVDIISTVGVKKCQPNKSKTMGTKVLPL